MSPIQLGVNFFLVYFGWIIVLLLFRHSRHTNCYMCIFKKKEKETVMCTCPSTDRDGDGHLPVKRPPPTTLFPPRVGCRLPLPAKLHYNCLHVIIFPRHLNRIPEGFSLIGGNRFVVDKIIFGN